MDEIDKPEETKRPAKPPRPPRPKTAKTRAAAAASSQRYRQRRRDAALPTGPEIDAALRKFVLKFVTIKPLRIQQDALGDLCGPLAAIGGWDLANAAVRAAIERRLEIGGPSQADAP